MKDRTLEQKTKKKETCSANLELVEALTKIVVSNKLQMLKFGEIEIHKSIHLADPIPAPKPKTPEELKQEADDLLFHSGV